MKKNCLNLAIILALAMLLFGCSSDSIKVKIEVPAGSIDVGDEVVLKVVGLTGMNAPVELGQTPVWEVTSGTISALEDNQAVFLASEAGIVTITVRVGEYSDQTQLIVGARIIAVSALDFVAQDGGSVQIQTDRTYPCFSHWDNLGHWLEWEFEIPESAAYVPVIMYSTGARYDVFRSVSVDGQLVLESVEFPNTGGFGRNPEEWRTLALEPIWLEAGKRILHIENIVPEVAAGLNPAWIALVYPGGLAASPDLVSRVNSILGL